MTDLKEIAAADPNAAARSGDAATWVLHEGKGPHDAIVPHDPLVGPAALTLAAKGLIPATALAADERVELAARKGETPDPSLANLLDARHHALWLSLVNPSSSQSRVEFTQLATAPDPVIALAGARLVTTETKPSAETVAYIRRAATGSTNPLAVAALSLLSSRPGL